MSHGSKYIIGEWKLKKKSKTMGYLFSVLFSLAVTPSILVTFTDHLKISPYYTIPAVIGLFIILGEVFSRLLPIKKE